MRYMLSVSTEMLFREFGDPMSIEQLRAITGTGIDMVEFWMWRNKDMRSVERAVRETGVSVLSMCADPQSHPVDPSRRDEFVDAVAQSLPVARRLGVPNLVVVAGHSLDGHSWLDQRRALTVALKEAALGAEDYGITVALENLNSRVDHRGTYLDLASSALDIVRDVDSPNVRLLYDLYHSIVMDEDPRTVLRGAIDLVAHVQLADHPGRHEPGAGRADWRRLTDDFDHVGYCGALGLEYSPSAGDSVASLSHIREVLGGAPQSIPVCRPE